MKRQLMYVLIATMALFGSYSLPAFAQTEPETEQESETMTQGDLALILAVKLGLAPDVPAMGGQSFAINALKQAGISPREGWNAEEEVTLGSLAVILAQVLGLVPENPEDDASVVEACTAAGVDFSSIASALVSAGILRGETELIPVGRELNDPLLRLPPGRPWSYFTRGGPGRESGMRAPNRPGFTPPPPPPGGGFRPPTPPPLTPN